MWTPSSTAALNSWGELFSGDATAFADDEEFDSGADRAERVGQLRAVIDTTALKTLAYGFRVYGTNKRQVPKFAALKTSPRETFRKEF